MHKYAYWIIVLAQIGFTKAQQPESNPGIHEYIHVDEEPKVMNLTEVRRMVGYPLEAHRRGIHGKMYCRVLVDAKGKYVKHRITKKIHPILTKAVEFHIQKLRFEPALKSNKRIPYWANIAFDFKANEHHLAVASGRLKDGIGQIIKSRGRALKHLGFAEEAYAEGKLRDAYEELVGCIKLSPKHPDSDQSLRYKAYFLRAKTNARMGRWEESHKDLTEAIGIARLDSITDFSELPHLSSVYLERASIHLRFGEITDAVNDYNFALQINPNPSLWNNEVFVSTRIKLEDYEEGILKNEVEYIENAKEGSLIGLYLKAKTEINAGNYESAVSPLDVVIQQTPYTSLKLAAIILQANAFSKASKHLEALTKIQDAIDLAPDNPHPYFHKGNVLVEIEGYEAAAENFELALENGLNGVAAIKAQSFLASL